MTQADGMFLKEDFHVINPNHNYPHIAIYLDHEYH